MWFRSHAYTLPMHIVICVFQNNKQQLNGQWFWCANNYQQSGINQFLHQKLADTFRKKPHSTGPRIHWTRHVIRHQIIFVVFFGTGSAGEIRSWSEIHYYRFLPIHLCILCASEIVQPRTTIEVDAQCPLSMMPIVCFFALPLARVGYLT